MRQNARLQGSIPACAGKPIWPGGGGYLFQVHPRVCGEAPGGRAQGHTVSGPSPRVRGSPIRPALRTASTRSIPACAGKPPTRSPSPRVRGSPPLATDGSIPACAGKPAGSLPPLDVGAGSIPACAGKPSRPSTVCAIRIRVHPRVCGEARIAACQSGPIHPRVCGEACDSYRWPRCRYGSIPACAGKPGAVLA